MSKKSLLLIGILATSIAPLRAATNFLPTNNSTGVPSQVMLTWTKTAGEVSYNVYLGTTSTLTDADFRGNQTEEKFWSGGLQSEGVYYWRVDVLSGGAPVAGTTRKFTVRKDLGYISKTAEMPALPALPLQIRDWKQVATDFDAFLDDDPVPNSEADFLPLLRTVEVTDQPNFIQDFKYLNSFVGWTGGDTGMLGLMTNIVGVTLCGVDKSDGGAPVTDYAKMAASYYSIDTKKGVVFNASNTNGGPGRETSIWYQLAGNVVFAQIVDLYTWPTRTFDSPINRYITTTSITPQPGSGREPGPYDLQEIFKRTATKWCEASAELKIPKAGTPTWDGYAYFSYSWNNWDNPDRGAPLPGAGTGGGDEDDEDTDMPHMAAAIGWLEYMAHTRFGSGTTNFLGAAEDAIGMLSSRPENENPAHDILLPYGAIAAARMNAEANYGYDASKILNWHFDTNGSINAATGVASGTNAAYGEYRVDGLVGKPADPIKKVYPLNTFMSAGVLAPVARYDQRFAPSMGRWLLNVANNARLFYANAFDDLHATDANYQKAHQTNEAWARARDTNYVMAYEFLGQTAYPITKSGNATLKKGSRTGGLAECEYDDNSNMVLQETPDATDGNILKLEHIWSFVLPLADVHKLKVRAKMQAPTEGGVKFSYRVGSSGAWVPITPAVVSNTDKETEQSWNFGSGLNLSGAIYIKVEGVNDGANVIADKLTLDSILVQSFIYGGGPFLGGGHMAHGGKTNLCLYQGSSAGYLGGLVEQTTAPEVLKIDLTKTDFFAGGNDPMDRPYPTYLFYNPTSTNKSFVVDLRTVIPGTENQDIYDTVTRTYLAKGAAQNPTVTIPAGETKVLVFTPAGSTVVQDGRIKKIGDVPIDYYAEGRRFADGFETGSLALGQWTTGGYTPSVLTSAKIDGTYGVKIAKDGSITKTVSTAGFENIRVKYRRKTTGTGESFKVEWLNGSNWEVLETLGVVPTGSSDLLLPKAAANQASLSIRFRNDAASTGAFAEVDSVQIVGTGRVAGP